MIKEIVIVFWRKKKILGLNKNELFILLEIIGEKSWNDIVMYLEDVKFLKSFFWKLSNDSVLKDLVKLLKNLVFVWYIDNKIYEIILNMVDFFDFCKFGLIFDRISGLRKFIVIEIKINMILDILFIKSNMKVLNFKLKELMVFLIVKIVFLLI